VRRQTPARPVKSARRSARPVRTPRPVQKAMKTGGDDATPNLSGPLARSLLARRLMARKAAEGDGGQSSERPLRVR
jgi:hypothetical protein